MIKASALYIVIVIALVIAVLCSSLIVAAYFYKTQYQRKFRYDMLHHNVSSAINIMLAETDRSYNTKKISLFGGDQDSVLLKSNCWGLYDIGVARSFIQGDTLTKIFSIAPMVDSAKWAAIYLIDEDRPLSVSGKTEIKGPAFIPKAGIKQAYVDNMAYTGNPQLIEGTKQISAKLLPALDETRMTDIKKLFMLKAGPDSTLHSDSVIRSFNGFLKVISFGKQVKIITERLTGYILVRSDTTINIANTARLKDVIICAKSVNVQAGFVGNCQLFATDSIHIQENCRFNYPSSIGVIQSEATKNKPNAQIILDSVTVINGALFTYQMPMSEIKPLISLGDHSIINGQIYSQGILSYKKQVAVKGSVFTSRFIYQSSYKMYENYLINIQINSGRLSSYYLTSGLFPVSSTKYKLLQWLK